MSHRDTPRSQQLNAAVRADEYADAREAARTTRHGPPDETNARLLAPHTVHFEITGLAAEPLAARVVGVTYPAGTRVRTEYALPTPPQFVVCRFPVDSRFPPESRAVASSICSAVPAEFVLLDVDLCQSCGEQVDDIGSVLCRRCMVPEHFSYQWLGRTWSFCDTGGGCTGYETPLDRNGSYMLMTRNEDPSAPDVFDRVRVQLHLDPDMWVGDAIDLIEDYPFEPDAVDVDLSAVSAHWIEIANRIAAEKAQERVGDA